MTSTRFAPSPNGPLHLGHAYAAIVAHDLARARDGEFLLRIEDIDGVRSRADLVEGIFADLVWLGLEWDGEAVFQSRRLAAYDEAQDHLKQAGLLYPCQCSRTDIATAARDMGPDGPVYPGTCRGRAVSPLGAAWRLDVSAALALTGPLQWIDDLAGEQHARPDLFGDMVLVRRDAASSYHLSATLDDATDGIGLVTRGMDLFAASHVHRLLQALLGLTVPRWHHHALLVEHDGRKLAKRRGSGQGGYGLAELRRAGAGGLALADDLRNGRLPTGISFGSGPYNFP